MTSKIFSIASFLLLAWLASTVPATSAKIESLEYDLNVGLGNTSSVLDAKIASASDKQHANHELLLEEIRAIANQPAAAMPDNSSKHKEEVAKLKAQLAKINRYADLKLAYTQLLEAEAKKQDDAAQAAELLLATKGPIWKSSTKFPNLKDKLQGLMGPIDSLANKWKTGDTSGTSKPVFTAVKQSMATLDADI